MLFYTGCTQTPHTLVYRIYKDTTHRCIWDTQTPQTFFSRIHTDTTTLHPTSHSLGIHTSITHPCIKTSYTCNWDTQTSQTIVSGIHRHPTPLFLGYTQTSNTHVQRTPTYTMTLNLEYNHINTSHTIHLLQRFFKSDNKRALRKCLHLLKEKHNAH